MKQVLSLLFLFIFTFSIAKAQEKATATSPRKWLSCEFSVGILPYVPTMTHAEFNIKYNISPQQQIGIAYIDLNNLNLSEDKFYHARCIALQGSYITNKNWQHSVGLGYVLGADYMADSIGEIDYLKTESKKLMFSASIRRNIRKHFFVGINYATTGLQVFSDTWQDNVWFQRHSIQALTLNIGLRF